MEGWQEFAGHSPHRPWIDAVKIACSSCGEQISRIRDVGNPWLDAGIVPFSTIGYRNDREHWRDWFPADWISESFPGQFRNWFYSLLAMSATLEETEPFKACFTYALLRDEHGEEMHKSKGNAIWFEDAADKMGVDVMRWMYLRHTPANNLNFGYGPGDEVRRQFHIPIWNVYSFFVNYANIDGWRPVSADGGYAGVAEFTELDRWIRSELHQTIRAVTTALETWRPETAATVLERFVDALSNWYVRRSRRRFWRGGQEQPAAVATATVVDAFLARYGADKCAAYQTLYECLTTLVKLLAPFTPFICRGDLPQPGGGGGGRRPAERTPVRLAADRRGADRRGTVGRHRSRDAAGTPGPLGPGGGQPARAPAARRTGRRPGQRAGGGTPAGGPGAAPRRVERQAGAARV